VFDRQTFHVWMGLKKSVYITKLSKNPFTCNISTKTGFWLIWLSRALVIRDIMHSAIEEIQFELLPHFNARVFF